MELSEQIQQLKDEIQELKKELQFYKMAATSAYVQPKFNKRGGTYTLNCMKPKTLNEKVIWLRENYYADCPVTYYYSDKYLFKYFIEKLCGKGFTPDLLGVWNNPANIDFSALPDKFVLKRTLSGGSYEVKIVDKSADDLDRVRKIAQWWVHDKARVPARVIAEKMIEPDSDGFITDYKIYVSRGKVIFCKILQMKIGSKIRTQRCVTPEFEFLNVKNNHKIIERDISKPSNWDEMIAFAVNFSKYFPFMRVDLYSNGNKFFIGELTDAPQTGLDPMDADFDKKMGGKLILPSDEEMSDFNSKFYELFPELKVNPIFLHNNIDVYRLEVNNQMINNVKDLPLPPSDFMQPFEVGNKV